MLYGADPYKVSNSVAVGTGLGMCDAAVAVSLTTRRAPVCLLTDKDRAIVRKFGGNDTAAEQGLEICRFIAAEAIALS